MCHLNGHFVNSSIQGVTLFCVYTLLGRVHNLSITISFLYMLQVCGCFVRVQVILMKNGKEHSPGIKPQPVAVEGSVHTPKQCLSQVNTPAEEDTTIDFTLVELCASLTYMLTLCVT